MTDSFMLVNYWTNLVDITPMPQWHRYNPNHVHQGDWDDWISKEDMDLK